MNNGRKRNLMWVRQKLNSERSALRKQTDKIIGPVFKNTSRDIYHSIPAKDEPRPNRRMMSFKDTDDMMSAIVKFNGSMMHQQCLIRLSFPLIASNDWVIMQSPRLIILLTTLKVSRSPNHERRVHDAHGEHVKENTG